MSSPIPIQNIYYLLVYAWNRLPESELVDVSGIESTELVDLFASVLIGGTNHLLRRGLDQSYSEHQAEIAGVRGRIDIGVTARRMLMAHGRTFCRFDELSIDTLPNQILRSTIRRLAGSASVAPALRIRLKGLDRDLGGISVVPLGKQLFRRVQLHGNNRFYRFLLSICELILDTALASEDKGGYQFRDFIRNDKRMAALFESFVFNFYRIHRPDLKISSERIYWQASSQSDPSLTFLPSMKTDISVRSVDKTLIIDTKFYRDTMQKHYGNESIHSGNLYQIFSYVKNLESRGGNDAVADGMLLYPTVGQDLRLKYTMPDHSIRVCTVNLKQPWQGIAEELDRLLSEFPR